MTRSFTFPTWQQVGAALGPLPVAPSTSPDGCFPREASHDYMADPHKPGFVICRNCANRRLHPRRDPYLTGQQAYEFDCVLTPKHEDGSARPTWYQLDEVQRWSWGRAPS